MNPPFPITDLARHFSEARQPSAFDSDCWALHAHPFELSSDSGPIRALAARALRFFPRAHPAQAPRLRLWLSGQRQWALPPEAEILPPSTNEVVDVRQAYGLTPRFARTEAVNYFELAPVAGAAYDFNSGHALGYINPAHPVRPRVLNNLFLQTVVLELLRGAGLFWVHAASVAAEGRAVLLVGHSGSGKTTTGLNLILSGFQFLSQDRTFIQSNGADLALLGFPEDLSITTQTLELLPALKQRLGPLPPAAGKYEIDPLTVFPEAFAPAARPGLILFPRVAASDKSTLHPLNRIEALQRLLPNSLLASHPDVARRHFAALSQLVEASRPYDLQLGRDIDRLPDLIRRQLPA